MGIGRRIAQALGGKAPTEPDPGATVEAGVVQLAEGPMLVERLRREGIEAAGIESVDPVSGIRTYMRIMVRRSELAAARQVMADQGEQPAGLALEEMDGTGMDEEAAAEEEASQQAMSRLFVAADRLAGRPGDQELLVEVEELSEVVAQGRAPFGVEPMAWVRVASLSEAVVGSDDDDGVRTTAGALRDFLRQYV